MLVAFITALLVTSQTSTHNSGSASAVISAETIINELEKSYPKDSHFSASFVQTHVGDAVGRQAQEYGQLFVSKDGKVRWTYKTPTRKDFIFDGNTAYFYEPESSQVTEFARFQDSQLYLAMRFLWGQGNINDVFNATLCKQCDDVDPRDLGLLLIPKKSMPMVTKIIISIGREKKQTKSTSIYDSIGNKTTYVFMNLKMEAHIDDKKFKFVKPVDVKTIHSPLTKNIKPNQKN